MATAGYNHEIEAINGVLNRALDTIVPPERGPNLPGTHYLLFVNGRVPSYEKPRPSVASCRSALRRRMRHRLEYLIRNPNVSNTRASAPVIPWDQWRRYAGPALERVIKKLEEDGIVEYRPWNFGQQEQGLAS